MATNRINVQASGFMTDKIITLNNIVDKVFLLNDPKIDNSRNDQIKNFIVSSVNGDKPIDSLVINASLGDNTRGAIVYILTNRRLIKFDISGNEIQSNSFLLETIASIERKLIDGDRAQYSITFQNGAFGLKYHQANIEITNFFQKVDEVWGRCNG